MRQQKDCLLGVRGWVHLPVMQWTSCVTGHVTCFSRISFFLWVKCEDREEHGILVLLLSFPFLCSLILMWARRCNRHWSSGVLHAWCCLPAELVGMEITSNIVQLGKWWWDTEVCLGVGKNVLRSQHGMPVSAGKIVRENIEAKCECNSRVTNREGSTWSVEQEAAFSRA